jgi:uncharacterized protein
MKTVIIGASENPDRYAHRAALSLLRHGHEIELVGLQPGQIADHAIQTGHPALTGVDTITLYVGAANQPPLYDYIESLHPRRVVFNPGAENPAFADRLRAAGIEPLEACTLVMLSIGTY